MQIGRLAQRILLCGALAVGLENLSGCGLLNSERVLYDQQDLRIGLEADPTVSRSGHQALNDHPAHLTDADLRALLQIIQVSGWSGTLTGLIDTPRPVPLFTTRQLSIISTVLVSAFREAKPAERIFFSLPKPDVSYSEERTVGALFLRGRYLHVVLTDHSAFMQADTAGGDLRDIRDTKGMKLWVSGPAQAAMVPDLDEPQWAPFETVHLSLNVKDTLAQLAAPLPARTHRGSSDSPPLEAPSPQKTEQPRAASDHLQLQIQELTSSNLELRRRLEEQTKAMEQLNRQMEQLRLDLESAKPKKQPSRKSPAQ
ncbi:MAG: hypothetical protein RI101_05855 [Nitrospira sp.]|jgi:hypothetical protein|nr:hypothetical protein [Nitrospira sp.]